jgi:tetratricopeptide (TPR) repeat protein/predicted Ser/Thr protein kinase
VACPDDNQLVAMLDHPSRFAELEIHMDSCDTCRKAVAALATARTLAVGTPGPGAGPDVDVVGDRYEIQSVLGRGGMGTVYLAHDRTLGRDVALKVHGAGSGNERLHREALAMAKLAHPNVVTVFEIGSFEDRLYVAMEYVKGGTLRDWLAKGRTWQQIVATLREVGAGLVAAHEAGLVHRDFKPENVLVASDGRPRVSDFGLARVGASITAVEPSGDELTDDALATRMTVTGAVVGTPAYMAPEQLAGEVVDARSDQFAFCVVAWEALFGARPWGGATLKELEKAIQRHELKASREVPERVRKVLERGLAIEPGDRWPDLRALLVALGESAKPRTRGWIAASVLGTALVVGGSYAAYASVSAHRHEAACAAAGDSVRKLVSPDAKAAIKAAFAATGAPYADSAYDHAASVLGRYADVLATATTATCKDDHAPKVRASCLDDHRTQLAAYLDQLLHADANAVLSAPDRAWGLFEPAPCASAEPRHVFAPADAAELARIHALDEIGKYQEAATAGEKLLAAARTRNDKELELASLLAVGSAEQELDHGPELVTLYHQAEALAESLGHDADAATAWQALATVEGLDGHDYRAAHGDLDLAKAKLERLGGANLALRGQVLATEAQVLTYEGRLPEAEADMKAALAALEPALGPDHPRVGMAYAILAQVEDPLGNSDQALSAARRGLAILSKALGDDHPNVAGARMQLARTLIKLKQYDEARDLLMKADAAFAHTFGPDHISRAQIYANLGELEVAQNHWDSALAAYRTDLQIYEKAVGPRTEEAASAHRDIAYTLALAGKLDDAIVEAQKGIDILDTTGTDSEPRLIGAETELAEMYVAREHPGDRPPALAAAQRAVELAKKRGLGTEDAELVAALTALDHAHKMKAQ